MDKDYIYMKRAINIAKKGRYVYPNPMAGAVIVKDKKIIAEGFHERFGGEHAEINALNKAGKKAEDSDIYINLEPCSHHGKTPPCADALVKAKIKRAVIAMRDPNPKVSRKGIEKLKKAGIEVKLGIMQNEAKALNRDYIKYIKNKKNKQPRVILKIAMTLDGKIATAKGESKWITCEKSRELVHKLRGESDAIIAGSATVAADNPLLTARIKGKHKNPVRVILASSCSIDMDSNVVKDKSAKTIIFTSMLCPEEKIKKFRENQVDVILLEDKKGKYFDLRNIIKILNEKGLNKIMIEAGSYLNFSALSSGIVDKIYIFIAPKIIGGKASKPAVGGAGVNKLIDAINIKNIKITKIGTDLLIEGEAKG